MMVFGAEGAEGAYGGIVYELSRRRAKIRTGASMGLGLGSLSRKGLAMSAF